MTSPREAFLQRVRRAVAEGNRPGDGAPIPLRGTVGYQGGGPDPTSRFRDELTAAGGRFHLAADPAAAADVVLGLVRERAARRVLLGRGPVLERLNLGEGLGRLGVEVDRVEDITPGRSRDAFFQAGLGVSGVDYLVAETGTVALFARPEEPRSLSLLPPVHVAVAEGSQIVADLFDLFALPVFEQRPPSCVTLITGPSKTGDIELRLVTGVHGPGELHVVLIAGC
jgi:L-lactate utilization protein LutC